MRFEPNYILDGQSLEDLTRQHSTKDVENSGPRGSGYVCNICGKTRNDFTAMKSHMEGAHFPPMTGYFCDYCHKLCKTKHALACHVSKYHKPGVNGVNVNQ